MIHGKNQAHREDLPGVRRGKDEIEIRRIPFRFITANEMVFRMKSCLSLTASFALTKETGMVAQIPLLMSNSPFLLRQPQNSDKLSTKTTGFESALQPSKRKGIPDWDGYHGHMIQILSEQNWFAVKAGSKHHVVFASLPLEKPKRSTEKPQTYFPAEMQTTGHRPSIGKKIAGFMPVRSGSCESRRRIHLPLTTSLIAMDPTSSPKMSYSSECSI